MSLLQPLDDVVQGNGEDYDRLPEPIKQTFSRREFLWMSDEQKARLTEQECEPEW